MHKEGSPWPRLRCWFLGKFRRNEMFVCSEIVFPPLHASCKNQRGGGNVELGGSKNVE
jgi:hypothetical protein